MASARVGSDYRHPARSLVIAAVAAGAHANTALSSFRRPLDCGPMPVTAPVRRLTEAEYLDFERKAEVKHEYLDGEIRERARASVRHCLITVNLLCEVSARLKGTSVLSFGSDLRLKVEATGFITYADFMLINPPIQLGAETDDIVVNPVGLFEVFSPATEAFDRGRRFQHYRRIPSLQFYVLVNLDLPQIEAFHRCDADAWKMTEAFGLESNLVMPRINVTLSLSDIYAQSEVHADTVSAFPA